MKVVTPAPTRATAAKVPPGGRRSIEKPVSLLLRSFQTNRTELALSGVAFRVAGAAGTPTATGVGVGVATSAAAPPGVAAAVGVAVAVAVGVAVGGTAVGVAVAVGGGGGSVG